jgi:hypothetical protein
MLKKYDPFENYHSFQWRQDGEGVHFYASDLRDQLGFTDEEDFEEALQRAMKVCRTLAISLEENFRSVYRFDSTQLVSDWKLSNLACYLVIVNANPENRNVARAQVYFAVKK